MLYTVIDEEVSFLEKNNVDMVILSEYLALNYPILEINGDFDDLPIIININTKVDTTELHNYIMGYNNKAKQSIIQKNSGTLGENDAILSPFIDSFSPNYAVQKQDTQIIVKGYNFDPKFTYITIDTDIIPFDYVILSPFLLQINISNFTINSDTNVVFSISNKGNNSFNCTIPIKLYTKNPIPFIKNIDPFNDNSQFCLFNLNNSSTDLVNSNRKTDSMHFKKDKFIWDYCLYRSAKVYADELKGKTVATFSMWVKWSGKNGNMVMGFEYYDIYTLNNYIGFNSSAGDLYGVYFKPYKNKWTFLTFVFKNEQYGDLYINGEKQTLKQVSGKLYKSGCKITTKFKFLGWLASSGYNKFGEISQTRGFLRELSQTEISKIYEEESKFIPKGK